VATGQGEDVIRIAGCHLVVEFMRQSFSPEEAYKKAIERLVKLKGIESCKAIQVCFIAIDKHGTVGAYSLQKGFKYAVYSNKENNVLVSSKYLI
jgi:N4-(beta-N-acetylglucosaminyl)-L-asparaginase